MSLVSTAILNGEKAMPQCRPCCAMNYDNY